MVRLMAVAEGATGNALVMICSTSHGVIALHANATISSTSGVR